MHTSSQNAIYICVTLHSIQVSFHCNHVLNVLSHCNNSIVESLFLSAVLEVLSAISLALHRQDIPAQRISMT